MSEPKGWEFYLPYLLRIAEKEIQSLAPVSSVRLMAEEGNLQLFGRPVANLTFDKREPLSETRRWFPVLKHLTSVLLENLILRNAWDGFLGKGVLRWLLEEGPVEGLLVSGKSLYLPPGTLRLSENRFFLPAFLKTQASFLKENWRQNRKFVAVSVVLDQPDSDLDSPLEKARLFGFSFLSSKAQRDLSPFFKELRSLKKLLRRKGSLLLLKLPHPPEPPEAVSLCASRGSNTSSSHKLLLPRRPSGIFIEGFYLLKTKLPVEKVLGTSGGLCGGIYEGDYPGAALALVYAAFEHARRLGGGLIRFEPFTYHVLGDLYADWGDMGMALWAYRQAEGRTPQPADLFNSQGLILKTLGLYEEAERAFRKALSLSPEDPLINFNLGVLLHGQGDPEGLRYLETAYRLSPERPTFAETLARALAEEGKLAEALEVLREVQGLTLEGRALLGRLLYHTGEHEEAFRCLKEVAHEREAPAEALAYLALLYRRKGEDEAALVLSREALRRGGSRIERILAENKGS